MFATRAAILAAVVLTLAACSESSPSTTPPTKAAPGASVGAPAATMPAGAPTGKINLNTASKETFLTIPDVGDKMAHEFDEYRPYASIQQFRKEMSKYVDAAKIAAYEKYVFVPIDFNTCDAPTLAQIPGLTESEATVLMDGRPYTSPAAFLDALAEHVDAADAKAATALLTSP